MDKQLLLQHVETAIKSSTKNPDLMAISSLKLADIMKVQPSDIEQGLAELVQEGKLRKEPVQGSHNEIFLLPNH
ncbi:MULTISPECIES: hypothetical protein [unclassified Paenibacillus]|uniref:hypothetical protein n=1 Tax=unclassified Paenibacillus TaxID=185978 RepID=UPI001AE487DC|nr:MULTISPECIES: hypothetical protein [unclassified Paenibacillus]MBP1153725.1 hypothetical protein [Paenibacillus sp. PvP091]MBP1170890.1 hypothetical protein [Paenibacillus sp. PvR098]MBP2441918.1 hypothetical protein [Paenibacillus sp. PvP052]